MTLIPKYRNTLNADEALTATYEDTDRRLQKYRVTDHEELKDSVTREGQRMYSNDLVSKIRKLNPHIWPEETNSTRFGSMLNFYTGLSSIEEAEQASKPEQYRSTKKCLGTAFPNQAYLPEFESINVDRADLAISPNRGWRTIVLRLLEQRIISWEQVKRTFGDATGPNSGRWKKETAKYRV